MNALILAAGLGTRLKPLTDTMPKALVPVNGKPLLMLLVERLKMSGFDNLVINVHHFAQQIIDYINKENSFGINVAISDESDMLLDTGGAIKKAAKLFENSNPFLVHNVDVFHNLNLKDIYLKNAFAADATLVVSDRVTSRYLLFNDDYNLVGWTNLNTGEVKSPFENVRKNPAAYNRFAFSGIHIFSHSLLKRMDKWPDRFSIIDFYLDACKDYTIRAINRLDLQLLDVGKLDSLEQAKEFLNCQTAIL